jgi:hypothetical protein
MAVLTYREALPDNYRFEYIFAADGFGGPDSVGFFWSQPAAHFGAQVTGATLQGPFMFGTGRGDINVVSATDGSLGQLFEMTGVAKHTDNASALIAGGATTAAFRQRYVNWFLGCRLARRLCRGRQHDWRCRQRHLYGR